MSDEYKSEILNMWSVADNYNGEDYSNYYVVYARHMNSNLLTRANWSTFKDVVEEYPNGEIGDDEWQIETQCSSHWMAGWIEVLLVHKDAPKEIIERFEGLVAAMSDYPVLDDHLYYTMQTQETEEFWEDMDEDQKRVFCKDRNFDTSNAEKGIEELDEEVRELIEVYINE